MVAAMRAAATYAPILTLEAFAKLRDDPRLDLGVLVATSGGFDPIHPGQ